MEAEGAEEVAEEEAGVAAPKLRIKCRSSLPILSEKFALSLSCQYIFDSLIHSLICLFGSR